MDSHNIISCPNCGAAARNHKNCEYCGSLMVRFVDKNIAIPDNDTFVYNGLVDALKHNLSMQRNTFEGQVVMTTISDDNGSSLSQVGTASYFEPFRNVRGASLAISYQFTTNSPNPEVAMAYRELLAKFKASDVFELYTPEEFEYGVVYCIDFGEDCEGAAVILSQFINHALGYSRHETLYFSTEVANQSDFYRSNGSEGDEKTTDWGKVWQLIIMIIFMVMMIIYWIS